MLFSELCDEDDDEWGDSSENLPVLTFIKGLLSRRNVIGKGVGLSLSLSVHLHASSLPLSQVGGRSYGVLCAIELPTLLGAPAVLN